MLNQEKKMSNSHKICTKCIMDTTDSNIYFDENGVCNHCKEYEERARKELHYDKVGQEKLKQLVNRIKNDGKDKKYDCIIGLSGGVDSSTVAFTVKRLGLRPLALHLDNEWNSEIAVYNIKNIVEKLNIDMRTYKVDWEEFKDLQLSFLKSSISNCEMITDHAIIALMFQTAAKKKIKYIIHGGNIVTEGVLPKSWGYINQDWKIIKGIQKKFGTLKLKKYSHLSLFKWIYYIFVKKIIFFPILNYVPYVKKDAKRLLEKELGWKDYGKKHYESIYTRFFQAYYLPVKFGFDKRRAHLSTLICSGQLTRKEALREISSDPYPTEEMKKKDREYVIKKLGLTEKEFGNIISQPIKSFKDYPNNHFLFKKLNYFVNLSKKITSHN